MLDDSRNDVFLHVDRRSKGLRKKIRSFAMQRAGFHILPDPIKVYWGDISQVEAEYKLFEAATAKGPYAYYHILSGMDLPIQTQDDIHTFFQQNAGKEFVGYWQSPEHKKDLDRKVSRYYLFTKSLRPSDRWHSVTTPLYNFALILQKLIHFRRKHEVGFQKGPNWVSITHDFCLHLLKEKPFALKRFKYTLCPDEIFVQTILWNSPFKTNIYCLNDDRNGCMRLIDWHRGAPYVWRKHDYEELIQSDKLFARKFSSDQMRLIQKIQSTYSVQ